MHGPSLLRGKVARAALAMVMGAAGLGGGAAGASVALATELPPPTGGHAVGTEVHHLTLPGRGTPVKPDGPRPLTIQVWYPAVANTVDRLPYLSDPVVLAALVEEGYYEQPANRLSTWGSIATSSSRGVTPIDSELALPLVVFSHGLGVLPSSYTLLFEGLASRGIVVVAVSHPYGSLSRTASGALMSLRQDTAIADEPQTLAAYEAGWAADLSDTLDWLVAEGLDAWKGVRGGLELRRVAAMGHSLGGAAAFEVCRTDPRFVACINLDGFSEGPVRTEGVGGAALYLKSSPDYSAEDHAARGRTVEQWDEMVRSLRPRLLESLAAPSSRPSYFASIHGTGHMSFTDAPFMMPETLSRLGGTYLSPERVLEIVVEVTRAFIVEELLEEEGTSAADTLETYSEIDWERVDP